MTLTGELQRFLILFHVKSIMGRGRVAAAIDALFAAAIRHQHGGVDLSKDKHDRMYR